VVERSTCLHRISGCFKGGEQDNNEIGKFHALLTLDSSETTRAIIPEAILAPAATTNTYLLAHIPLLMAGHEYICSLEAVPLDLNPNPAKCQFARNFLATFFEVSPKMGGQVAMINQPLCHTSFARQNTWQFGFLSKMKISPDQYM
jgi:hypothetical protein